MSRVLIRPNVRRFPMLNRQPPWPYRMNRDSAQAEGLRAWFPMANFGNSPAPARDFAGTRTFDLTNNGGIPWTRPTNGAGPFAPNFPANTSDYFNRTSTVPVTTWPATLVANVVPDTPVPFGSVCGVFDNGSENTYIEIGCHPTAFFVNAGNAGTFNSANSTFAPAANTHYQIVNRVESDGTVHNWVNGQFEATEAGNSPISGITANECAIGVRRRLSPTLPFDGWIWDVRYYDITLTPAMIEQLWNPATRFELYEPIGPGRVIIDMSPPAAVAHASQLVNNQPLTRNVEGVLVA